ncbi:unnamed protein product [Effrenium voratum]|nr:unnamed protein product [Effrenium voratum]
MAAAGIWLKPGEDPHQVAQDLAAAEADNASLPRLAEEDLVQFMVKLSVEGFPQAVKVRKMQKFHGSILEPPKWLGEPAKPWEAGLAFCAEVGQFFGRDSHVRVHQENCGQIRFQAGDKVTFCIPEEPERGALPEAKLVVLASTDRPFGAVLSCCRIHLPRPGGEAKAPLCLDLHAFTSKVVLSGLSIDVTETELMRFFNKQGATKGLVAHARGCSFASIAFPSLRDVATFLGRSAHAFADDKETRIAMLLNRAPTRPHTADQARLPAIPAPTISPGEDHGCIHVGWAPLALAIGYVVEVRPVSAKVEWSPVDVGGRLGASGAGGYFAPSCSSCKVSGLQVGFAYEARVTYISSCGCRSEASDSSAPCAPGEQPWQQPSAPWPEASKQVPGSYGTNSQPASTGLSTMSTPTWRCVHGAVVPPPSVPELIGDEAGFSVAVRWPSVGHAAAYVIEFREAGSKHTERFVRQAVPAAPGSLVELRVGGLRPIPGRIYVAQVRCIAHCGCESQPSSPACSPPSSGIGAPEAPRWEGLPSWTSSEVQMPNGFHGSRYSGPMADGSPLSVHLDSGKGADSPQDRALKSGLPGLHLAGGASLVPETSGKDFSEIHQELPPEVTGQEDCLILD